MLNALVLCSVLNVSTMAAKLPVGGSPFPVSLTPGLWEGSWTYLHSLATSLPIAEFYSSHPNVCIYSLSIVCGLVLFLAIFSIRICLTASLAVLAWVTRSDVLRDFVGVEDTPDTLRENPFWAGTHERKRAKMVKLNTKQTEKVKLRG